MRPKFAMLALTLLLLPLVSGAAAAATGPTLFGQVANNGALIGIETQDILGNWNPVYNGQLLQGNTIYVTAYSPNGNGSLTLVIEQYTIVMVTTYTVVGNRTVAQKTPEDTGFIWSNMTLLAPTRSLATSALTLPPVSSTHVLLISYDGAQWTLSHRTAPALFIIPTNTVGEQLAFFLTTLILATGVWSIATATAAAIKKRARSWPKMNGRAVVSMLILGGMAAVFLLEEYYFEVASVGWWWWLPPFYLVCTRVMLNYLSDHTERWAGVETKGPDGTGNNEGSLEEIVVSSDPEHKWIRIRPGSTRAAIARLFGLKTPVKFSQESAEWQRGIPWHIVDPKAQPGGDDISRLYFLDPGTSVERHYTHIGWVPWLGGRLKRPGIVQQSTIIPLAGSHSKDALKVWQDVVVITEVAKEKERLQYENIRLRSQIAGGAIKGGRVELGIVGAWLQRAKELGLSDEHVNTAAEVTTEEKQEGYQDAAHEAI